MARWIALFEGNLEAGWVRKTHAREHFEYLAGHADRVLIGGGLRSEPDAWWDGGLWVMEVATR